MVSIIRIYGKNQYEFVGLSLDTKPTDAGANSLFLELDTKKLYYFVDPVIGWLESGTKPETDLTNTTWLLNESLSEETAGVIFALDFTSNKQSFSALAYSRSLMYGNTRVYSDSSKTWSVQAYRTITITGGADATDENTIRWLRTNAIRTA